MPVEIKELIIRAVVPAEPREPARPGDQDRIVDACVKQVLRVIKKSRER